MTVFQTARKGLQYKRARIGQGPFRDDLLMLWNGRCAVTGLDLPELLRASHIKPWRDSNNTERLDRYNGLLLAPAYDAAFDNGLITFRDDGTLAASEMLTGFRLSLLGINPAARITHSLHQEHLEYLAHHRAEIFRRTRR